MKMLAIVGLVLSLSGLALAHHGNIKDDNNMLSECDVLSSKTAKNKCIAAVEEALAGEIRIDSKYIVAEGKATSWKFPNKRAAIKNAQKTAEYTCRNLQKEMGASVSYSHEEKSYTTEYNCTKVVDIPLNVHPVEIYKLNRKGKKVRKCLNGDRAARTCHKGLAKVRSIYVLTEKPQ